MFSISIRFSKNQGWLADASGLFPDLQMEKDPDLEFVCQTMVISMIYDFMWRQEMLTMLSEFGSQRSDWLLARAIRYTPRWQAR